VLAILDTNVLVSALRSRRGASNEVVRRLAAGQFEAGITTALVLEYDDVLHRPGMVPLSAEGVDAFIDSICAICKEAFVYFNWRPFLPDPKDDLVLECAIAAGATYLVTHNLRDFPELEVFGLSVVTPGEFIAILNHEFHNDHPA
jgi:predicted nucleic acid-binding protein